MLILNLERFIIVLVSRLISFYHLFFWSETIFFGYYFSFHIIVPDNQCVHSHFFMTTLEKRFIYFFLIKCKRRRKRKRRRHQWNHFCQLFSFLRTYKNRTWTDTGGVFLTALKSIVAYNEEVYKCVSFHILKMVIKTKDSVYIKEVKICGVKQPRAKRASAAGQAICRRLMRRHLRTYKNKTWTDTGGVFLTALKSIVAYNEEVYKCVSFHILKMVIKTKDSVYIKEMKQPRVKRASAAGQAICLWLMRRQPLL